MHATVPSFYFFQLSWDLRNFCWGYSRTVILPISAFHIAGMAGMSHQAWLSTLFDVNGSFDFTKEELTSICQS
jgi:hypothetical protein